MTKYLKLNTVHPQYGAQLVIADTEFLVEYPNNLFSNNVAADGRNQSWAKVLDTTTLNAGVVLDQSGQGAEHSTKVLVDVRSAGWES